MAFSERGFRREDSIGVQTLIDGQNEIIKYVNDRELSTRGPLPVDTDLRRKALETLRELNRWPSHRMTTEEWFALYEVAQPEKISASALWARELQRTLKSMVTPQDAEAQHYFAMTVVTDATYSLRSHGFISNRSYDNFCAAVDAAKLKVRQTVAFECLPPNMALEKVSKLEDPIYELVTEMTAPKVRAQYV